MFIDRRKISFSMLLLGLMVAFAAPLAFARQDLANATRPRRVSKATSQRTIPSGQEATLEGNVTKVGDDSFSVCDLSGAETVVRLTGDTHIKTHRRGIFRGAKGMDKSALLIGLLVTTKGRGNDAGELVAKWVRFHDSNYKAATVVDTRAIPLEREQDRMAGQLDETTAVATAARKEAKAAQDSADKAQGTADQARNEAAVAGQTALRAHEKIAAIDDFETTADLVVNFKAGSAVLSQEAKAKLDEFAAKSVRAKGYVIEISAFTSEEGGEAYNRRLSAARADAVMDYLIDAGKVAPRRFVPPYAGGESHPIADNQTREGREQNRRAEVKLLVSKGLAAKEPATAAK